MNTGISRIYASNTKNNKKILRQENFETKNFSEFSQTGDLYITTSLKFWTCERFSTWWPLSWKTFISLCLIKTIPYISTRDRTCREMAFRGYSPSLSWITFCLKPVRTSSLGMKYCYAQHWASHLDHPSELTKEKSGERKCHRISLHVRI